MFRKTALFLVCLIISSAPTANAQLAFAVGAENAIIAVSQVVAEAGEAATIVISLEANPGIAFLHLSIQYDDTRLRIESAHSAARGSALGNLAFTGLIPETYRLNPMPFMWFGARIDTTIGIILTIDFLVLDDALAGDAAITITAQDSVARAFDGVAFPVLIAQGGVRILGYGADDDGSMAEPNIPQTTRAPQVPQITQPAQPTQPPPTQTATTPANAPNADENDFYAWWLRRGAELYEPVAIVQTSFNDVSHAAWYYDAVSFAAARELFSGIGGGLFAPQANMTRAMFVTVLARLDGADLARFDESTFGDVDINEWYGSAIAWAMMVGVINHGILADNTPNTFQPYANITREEMAAIIDSYLEVNNFSLTAIDAPQFADINEASPWARNAIQTMRRYSIIHGIGDNNYNPQGQATRAEVAQIFMNLVRAIVGLN